MADKFYAGTATKGYLQQGDIFPAVPFPALDLTDFSFMEDPAHEVNTVNLFRTTASPRGLCILSYELHWAIVTTQTCDLQPRVGKDSLPVTFARITPYSQTKSVMDKAISNRAGHIVEMLNERGKHPAVFPLGSYYSRSFQFEGGVVALTSLVSVARNMKLKGLEARRRLRLSQIALQSFQERLGCGSLRTALPEKANLANFLQIPPTITQP